MFLKTSLIQRTTNEMLLRTSLTKFSRIVHHNTVRTCTHQVNPPQTTPSSDWNPVYNFPQIKLLGGLNKLKIHQSAITAIGVPVLMGLESMQIVPPDTTELFAVLGITATISLCIYSVFSTKIIGFVYVNPVLKKIRFSYIDFWGRRKDQDLRLEELVSSDEKRLFDTYTVVKTETPAGSLKLLRFGKITDPDVFYMIFGDI